MQAEKVSKEGEVFKEGETSPSGFTVENVLNSDENNLPFGLYNPETDGKVTWICGYGPKNDIISVFACDLGNRTEKQVKMLADLKEAIFFREELVKNGWKKIIPPKINFTTTKEDGTTSEMNRQQRRLLAKKMKTINKTVRKA